MTLAITIRTAIVMLILSRIRAIVDLRTIVTARKDGIHVLELEFDEPRPVTQGHDPKSILAFAEGASKKGLTL